MAHRMTRRAELRLAAVKRGLSWVPSRELAKKEIRRTRRRLYRRHRRKVLLFILIFSLLAGGAIFYFGFDLVTLRGSGMSPTMNGGDMVLCVKQSMLNRLAGIIPEEYRRIRRNDVVLVRYRPPSANDEEPGVPAMLVIKRVIGQSGDEFDVGGGQLILNQETLVGDAGNSDLVYPVKVPAGRMFLMGDDTAVSIDSRRRAFGMPAEADVEARPLAVVWPLFAIGLVK